MENLSRVFFALTLSATTVGPSVAEADNWTKAKVATASIFRLADSRSRIDPTEEGQFCFKHTCGIHTSISPFYSTPKVRSLTKECIYFLTIIESNAVCV